jgi:hypothetical protein
MGRLIAVSELSGAKESVWQPGSRPVDPRVRAGIFLNLKSRLEAGATKNSANRSCHRDTKAHFAIVSVSTGLKAGAPTVGLPYC